jgi:hypothetical protein
MPRQPANAIVGDMLTVRIGTQRKTFHLSLSRHQEATPITASPYRHPGTSRRGT